MTSEEISEWVKSIIVEELGVDTSAVTSDARLAEDLGADSFDRLLLLMRLEEEFDTEIPDAVARRAYTVREVVACFTPRVGAGAHE